MKPQRIPVGRRSVFRRLRDVITGRIIAGYQSTTVPLTLKARKRERTRK